MNSAYDIRGDGRIMAYSAAAIYGAATVHGVAEGARADEALYAAKRAGGDQTIVARPN